MLAELIGSITYVTLGVGAALVIILLVTGLIQEFISRSSVETTEDRIARLTSKLSEMSRLVAQIELEIKERTSLAEKLQEDVKTYNEVVNLRRDEVEAVAQLLRGELRSEGKKSFWQQFAVNLFFFLLGVAASIVVPILIN